MSKKESVLARAGAHPLFSGLSEKKIGEAIALFDGRVAEYKKGDSVRAMGLPFPTFGLVISGGVQVFSLDIDGSPMMMANVGEGDSFGESLAYLGTEESPVYVTAAQPTMLLWLDATALRLRVAEGDPFALALSERFASVLATRALSQNDRIQILSKPKIRERIVTFLSQCERRYGSRTFIIPFDRASLAVYLGVNRSALSRELAKMKQEGVIDFFRSSFRIL
jgi:CRP-like cAMP-binding protein